MVPVPRPVRGSAGTDPNEVVGGVDTGSAACPIARTEVPLPPSIVAMIALDGPASGLGDRRQRLQGLSFIDGGEPLPCCGKPFAVPFAHQKRGAGA